MDGAEESPFTSDFVDSSHQELSEASGLLDLSKDRLDDIALLALLAKA